MQLSCQTEHCKQPTVQTSNIEQLQKALRIRHSNHLIPQVMNHSASPNPTLPAKISYLSILSIASIGLKMLHVTFVFDFFKTTIHI